jgi:peptidoglycan/LPS O-acetylase OafA/YrhL
VRMTFSLWQGGWRPVDLFVVAVGFFFCNAHRTCLSDLGYLFPSLRFLLLRF